MMNGETNLSTSFSNPVLAVQAADFSVLMNQPGRFLSYALPPCFARYDSNKDFSRIFFNLSVVLLWVEWANLVAQRT